jgi:hypothetical protein
VPVTTQHATPSWVPARCLASSTSLAMHVACVKVAAETRRGNECTTTDLTP